MPYIDPIFKDPPSGGPTLHLNMRLIRRFQSKVMKHGRTTCWLWTGGYNSRTGYPYLDIKSKRIHATKISFAISTHPPDSYVQLKDIPILGLSCQNKRCVRFEHLTPGVYTRRGVGSGEGRELPAIRKDNRAPAPRPRGRSDTDGEA